MPLASLISGSLPRYMTMRHTTMRTGIIAACKALLLVLPMLAFQACFEEHHHPPYEYGTYGDYDEHHDWHDRRWWIDHRRDWVEEHHHEWLEEHE